ncbi:MAG: DUF1127 domain-containing protein [Yoonia sp.]|jgi:uncharacterized protein YjiS (DUF1127 family)|nr:DUF1127 domain-containing protein [Yoonia sp.]
MAFLSTSDFSAVRPSFLKTVTRVIGGFFTAVMEANSRHDQVQRLSAMSDAQLAEFGVRREDIVRYVFRDVYHL